MSGHSKWSTIKRKKGANDQARGKAFSKLSKAISLAVKTGGSDNPDFNYKLRIAIDAAKTENMPKDTIDRAIKKASETGDLSEVTYEGFGPEGVQFLIEIATDNKNRTSAEIKSLLQKAGGNLGGPGSVSFNFDPVGFILLTKVEDKEEATLDLIDMGAENVEETAGGLEVHVPTTELSDFTKALTDKGYIIAESAMIQLPKTLQKIEGEKLQERITKLMSDLDDHEDVQNVYTNADF